MFGVLDNMQDVFVVELRFFIGCGYEVECCRIVVVSFEGLCLVFFEVNYFEMFVIIDEMCKCGRLFDGVVYELVIY